MNFRVLALPSCVLAVASHPALFKAMHTLYILAPWTGFIMHMAPGPWISLQEHNLQCWIDGSAVKVAALPGDLSSIPSPCDCSQPSVIPIPGDPIPSSSLPGYCIHAQTYMQMKHLYT